MSARRVFHSGSKALRPRESGVWRRLESRGARIEPETRCDLFSGLQGITGHQDLCLPGPLPISEVSQFSALQSHSFLDPLRSVDSSEGCGHQLPLQRNGVDFNE